MDYGKYKYEAAQKAKESRRKSTNVVIKEMKYRPKIGGGDFDTKTRKVEKFLSEGHKVKITIMFRGREVAHPELGKKILDRVAEEVETGTGGLRLDLTRRLAAEALGTGLLVMAVVGSGIAASRLPAATSGCSCSRTRPPPPAR